ncbi:MAG: thioredoxin family protein [Alphaproteobacteria bacterium]|nr:thioredoxin family protein [Alphaproteobacteria bacterium]
MAKRQFTIHPLRWAAVCLALAAAMIAPLPARAGELIMVERPSCVYCLRWMAEVAPSYQKSPEAAVAPLRRYDLTLGPLKGVELKRPVRYTPTFILVDNGREVDRITGYLDNATFWGLYAPMIARLSAGKTTGAPPVSPKDASK